MRGLGDDLPKSWPMALVRPNGLVLGIRANLSPNALAVRFLSRIPRVCRTFIRNANQILPSGLIDANNIYRGKHLARIKISQVIGSCCRKATRPEQSQLLAALCFARCDLRNRQNLTFRGWECSRSRGRIASSAGCNFYKSRLAAIEDSGARSTVAGLAAPPLLGSTKAPRAWRGIRKCIPSESP